MAGDALTPAEQRVALGPVEGTDWCVLDGAPAGLVAPGGVVLCQEATLTAHPDAERAARSAWEILDRWRASEVRPDGRPETVQPLAGADICGDGTDDHGSTSRDGAGGLPDDRRR